MKLYWKFFAMHLKSRMAYKGSFLMSVLGQFLTSFTAFLTLTFMFDRFQAVKGYTIGDCMLCSGVIVLSFALAEMFFRSFDSFQGLVREASLDRLMLRPRGLIFQVLCHQVEFGRLGVVLQSFCMLGYGVAVSTVVWTAERIAVLILMIMGGTILFACLFVMHAAVCFFTIDSIEAFNILTYGAREYGGYPLDVYGGTVLKLCTYLIPYALVQYYPLQYLLGRTDSLLCALAPLLAPLFALPSYALWRLGVSKYQSAGS